MFSNRVLFVTDTATQQQEVVMVILSKRKRQQQANGSVRCDGDGTFCFSSMFLALDARTRVAARIFEFVPLLCLCMTPSPSSALCSLL